MNIEVQILKRNLLPAWVVRVCISKILRLPFQLKKSVAGVTLMWFRSAVACCYRCTVVLEIACEFYGLQPDRSTEFTGTVPHHGWSGSESTWLDISGHSGRVQFSRSSALNYQHSVVTYCFHASHTPCQFIASILMNERLNRKRPSPRTMLYMLYPHGLEMGLSLHYVACGRKGAMEGRGKLRPDVLRFQLSRFT